MREHGIALGGDAHAAELAGQIVEVRHLDAGDVVEITRPVGIAAYPIGSVADLPGDVADIRQEPLPLLRDALVGLESVASPRPAISSVRPFSKRGGSSSTISDSSILNGSTRVMFVEMALRANRFGRQAELIAERTGERLVRTIAGVERDGQDVRRAGHEMSRGLGQAAAAHIAHHRLTGRHAERAQQVVA